MDLDVVSIYVRRGVLWVVWFFCLLNLSVIGRLRGYYLLSYLFITKSVPRSNVASLSSSAYKLLHDLCFVEGYPISSLVIRYATASYPYNNWWNKETLENGDRNTMR